MLSTTSTTVPFVAKNVIYNDLVLHTEAFGNRQHTACICIAGKRSTARFWSDEFCSFLAKKNFFVIRYDSRDVGESSAIDWQKSPYSIIELAKDTIVILNDYNIDKANIIGNSMGSLVCQQIGISYPERVINMIVISGVPIEFSKETFPITKLEQQILDNTEAVFAIWKFGNSLNEAISNFLPIWRHLNADIPLDEESWKKFTIDFLTRTKNNNSGENHDLMMRQFLSNMKPLKFLPQINLPTLVIHGEKDPVVLQRHGREIANAIPNAKFVVIPGMGHAFFNKKLEKEIAQIIANFIAATDS